MNPMEQIRAIARETKIPVKVWLQLGRLQTFGAPELVDAVTANMLPLKHAVRLARKLTKPQQAKLAGALHGLGKRDRLALVVATLRTSKAPGGHHG
jgi:hypothetical protein